MKGEKERGREGEGRGEISGSASFCNLGFRIIHAFRIIYSTQLCSEHGSVSVSTS